MQANDESRARSHRSSRLDRLGKVLRAVGLSVGILVTAYVCVVAVVVPFADMERIAMKNLVLEKEIEKKFLSEAKRKDMIVVKFTDPARKGAPDRLVIGPWQQVFFVEFKRPSGRLARHQIRYAERLNALEHNVYLIDTMEKVRLFFETDFWGYEGFLLLRGEE